MKFTMQQRILALEREVSVLHDTMKLLHGMLKEQRELINDFIVQKVVQSSRGQGIYGGGDRPEKEVFTFVCRQKFEKIEQDVVKNRKLIDNLRFGLRAG